MNTRRFIAAASAAMAGLAGLLLPGTLAGAVEAPPIPELAVSPEEVPIGSDFVVTATNCIDEENVRFSFLGAVANVPCVDGTASTTYTAHGVDGSQGVFASFGTTGPDAAGLVCTDLEIDGLRPCILQTSVTLLPPPPPSFSVSPSSGDPEFAFTMTLDNCGAQVLRTESVSVSEVDIEPIKGDQQVEFVLPETGQVEATECTDPPGSVTSGTFTAPEEPGDYTVLVLFLDFEFGGGIEPRSSSTRAPVLENCSQAEGPVGCLEATITVDEVTETIEPAPTTTTTEPAPTTTEPAPTTTEPAPTTTEAPAPETTVEEQEEQEEQEVLPAPPEQPVMALPATGAGDAGSTALWAMLLLLVGVAAVAAAQARRSPTRTTD